MPSGCRPIRIVRLLVLVGALLSLSFLHACAYSTNPVSGEKQAMGYSWAQEVEVGENADKQIRQQFGFYTEGDIDEYVERVGRRVLQESHLRRPGTDRKFRKTEFTFRILDSDTPNAFALPGGYVYLTRGLVTRLNNEAQLAVVLGHEIAHVAARHASRQAFQQQAGQLALMAGAILGQEAMGLPARQILDLGGTAAKLLFLKYSRDDEREADELGVEYAALAGYRAAEGAAFFESLERISDKEGQGVPAFLSTHPDPGNREERIVALARQWQPEAAMTRVAQPAYYEGIDGMVIGANPRQGFVRDGHFYHPELRFSFRVPTGFDVENTASQVAMIDQQQRAALIFSLAQAGSPREAAADLASQQGIQILRSGRASASGNPAYALVADAQTEQQRVRLLAFFVAYSDRIYRFLGYTSPQLYGRYQDAFLRSARSLERLEDPEILDVQPLRLDVVQGSRTAPFRRFVADAPYELAQLDADDLAIMNQVSLDTHIEAGRALKLPERSTAGR